MEEREIRRKNEEIFLKLKIADNECLKTPLTAEELIEYMRFGYLPVEISEEDGTKVLNEGQIQEIEQCIPNLLKIVKKPKSFIKLYEEKVPIEIAKKINHKAISKLSMDSNDWYARTIINVKPKNVMSDLNEETIDLYENRFICSLTDKIAKLVASRRQYYKQQIKDQEDNSAIYAMGEEYHTTREFPFFNEINKNAKYFSHNITFRDKLQAELDKTIEVEKKIRSIKMSEFYMTLHKKKKVTDPIQKTNILMFEKNYKKAYKLWKSLNQYREEDVLKNDIIISEEELKNHYFLYCFIIILSALHELDFAEKTGHKIIYKDNILQLENDLKFVNVKNSKDSIEIRLNKEYISLEYQDLTAEGKKDKFLFYPNFVNFENMNRSEVDAYTEQILNNLQDDDRYSQITSIYSLVSINMNICSENNVFSDKVYRRFYGIGNNYSQDENKENLKNWGGYKRGILIITPSRLRDNLLKIEQVINYHILKGRNVSTFSRECPICGSKHIVNNGGNYICYSCKRIVSVTYCNECDKKHQKPILWVRYINDNFLKREDVVRGDFANLMCYDKMSKIEIIMGKRATTTFELEKDVSGWKLKTICPYCGIKLGSSKN